MERLDGKMMQTNEARTKTGGGDIFVMSGEIVPCKCMNSEDTTHGNAIEIIAISSRYV